MKKNLNYNKINKVRCVAGFIISILIVILTFYAVTRNALSTSHSFFDGFGWDVYKMFTIDINVLLAVAIILTIPSQIDGFRSGNFHLPRWIVNINYIAIVGTSFTLLACCLVLGPIAGFAKTAYGSNLFLHYIIPVLGIILFLFVHNDHTIKLKMLFISIIPILVYCSVYGVFVLVISEENGGWADFYQILSGHFPIYVLVLLVLVASFSVAWLMRFLHNFLHKKYQNQTKAYYVDANNKFESIENEINNLAKTAKRSEGGMGDILIPKRKIRFIKEKYDSELSIKELCDIYLEYYFVQEEQEDVN